MSATRSGLAAPLAVLALVSACTATSVNTGPAAPNDVQQHSASPAPRARPVCRSAPVARRRFVVRSDGVRRAYLLTAPRLVGHRPLVVLFHGFGQQASFIDAYTQMPRAGAAAGFAVATPQGLDDRWNFPRREAVGPDDVRFVRTMVSAIARRVCVDPEEVFAVGFSDGADMADTLGCFDHQIQAVAGVAASVVVHHCRHPVDALQIHGNADPVVPYVGGGGDRPPPFEGTEAIPVSRQMHAWRALDGCPADRSRRRGLVSGVTVVRALGCAAGRRVVLVVVRGGGHTWPGASVNLPFGGTNHRYHATNRILAFFEHGLGG